MFSLFWFRFFLCVIFKAEEVINTELQQVKDLLLELFHGFLAKYFKLKALLNGDKWRYINFLEVRVVYTKRNYGKLYT